VTCGRGVFFPGYSCFLQINDIVKYYYFVSTPTTLKKVYTSLKENFSLLKDGNYCILFRTKGWGEGGK
jgi:hypothetical protein